MLTTSDNSQYKMIVRIYVVSGTSKAFQNDHFYPYNGP